MRTLPLAAATTLALACAPPRAAVTLADYADGAPLAGSRAPEPPALRALVLGDYGDSTPRQRSVTDAVLRWHAARPFDLALQPGDDLYPCGPDPRGGEGCRFGADGATLAPGFEPPVDPTFARNEGPLGALLGRDGAPVPSFLALGNHDVGAPRSCRTVGEPPAESMRRRACLEVAHRSAVWHMPARHYVRDEGPVRFIVVDSNVAVADYAGFTLAAEEAFVREASRECATRPCFLVAHHPPAMAIGASPPRRDEGLFRMRRLVDAAGGRLAAVLAGHVHALEHLSYGDLDVFISGAGARPVAYRFAGGWPADVRLHFASSAGGFGVLEVWPGGWGVRLVDDRDRPLHCCEAWGRDRCRPVTCREGP